MPRPRKTSYDDDKPPYSYVALCTMAINSSPSKMMTLNAIYTYIMEKFPFYRKCSLRWQNSLRHNLSYNDCFVKISKGTSTGDQSGSGKGSYWALHKSSSQMFQEGSYLRRKRRFHNEEASNINNGIPSSQTGSHLSNIIDNHEMKPNPTTHINEQHEKQLTRLKDQIGNDENSKTVYTGNDGYLRDSASCYTRFTIDSILKQNSNDIDKKASSSTTRFCGQNHSTVHFQDVHNLTGCASSENSYPSARSYYLPPVNDERRKPHFLTTLKPRSDNKEIPGSFINSYKNFQDTNS